MIAMPEADKPTADSPDRDKWIGLGQLVAYAVGLAIVVPGEFARFAAQASGEAGVLGYFVDINVDTTLFLGLLAIAPFVWHRSPYAGRTRWSVRLNRWFGQPLSVSSETAAQPANPSRRVTWMLAIVVGATSLFVSTRVAAYQVHSAGGKSFGDLPPAYHDEYSYLFQAKTVLAGRLSFPSHLTAPRLFDQMHVLNEGRFASRYFPGAGAWIAPFLAAGNPFWGHWLAGCLSAMLVFGIGRELSGNAVGFIAGMLTALSPGMALFSNLLLAHHPTLLGLMLFIFAFLKMQRTGRWPYALLAGCGLSFAMLCRPMTAAGIGLPFGLWFLWSLFGRRGGVQAIASTTRDWPRARLTGALAIPLLAGFAIILIQNNAITGSVWKTPYQLYTDIYTPRHGYGFNNVVRGEQRLEPREHLKPRVIENYDRWAENLTPALAWQNVQHRLIASWQSTLGIVPLALATIVFVFGASTLDRRWWLIAAAIVSLSVVHIPYWFVGIMHWHYVFESGPLWCLIFAAATQILIRDWQTNRRRWMPLWWTAITAAAMIVSYVPAEPFWETSRLAARIEEVAFSKTKYDRFRQLLAREIQSRPALVLIEPDPTDRHIDLINNDPDLNSDILLGRFDPQKMQVARIAEQFPQRSCYLYRAQQQQLIPITPP